jgi:hypothetical protein
MNYKPTLDEIHAYLGNQTSDNYGNSLSERDKEYLSDLWVKTIAESINKIEEGDKLGLEYYYYDFDDKDPVCEKVIKRGLPVSRKDIYLHPEIIPPFHIGCRCILKGYCGLSEDLIDARGFVIAPFYTSDDVFSPPTWKEIINSAKEEG